MRVILDRFSDLPYEHKMLCVECGQEKPTNPDNGLCYSCELEQLEREQEYQHRHEAELN